MKMRVFCVLLITTATPVFAQFAPGQDGRANDANNQIGSGGFNAPVQQTYFNTANLYVTGNVTSGRSFQGYSPIRDTSSIFLSLPSSNIGLFQRDSVGVAQVYGAGPLSAQPFFNPSQTVTGITGIERGLNMPGGSVPQYTTTIPQGTVRTPYGTPDGLSYGLNYNPAVVPNSSIYTSNNYPLLNELYAPSDASGIEALRSGPQYGQSITNTYPVSRIGDREADDSLLNRRMREINPLVRRTRSIESDDQAPTSDQMLANSRNLLSPSSLAPHLFGQDRQDGQRDALTGRLLPPPPRYAATPDNVAVDPASGMLAPIQRFVRRDVVGAGRTVAGDLSTGETTVVEGYDADGDVDDNQPMDAEERIDDSVRSPLGDSVVQSAVATLGGAASRDFSDFDDRNRAKVNELVSQAERHVAAGDFYKAGNSYDLAITFDPENPYIRFGYGHALLAAGEYLTAVHQIEIGIDLLPRIRGFRPNFTALAGQQQILDVRRADLERRLDRKEDFRLRFLLGYTEYYTDLEKFGLPNLQKAAQNAPAGTLIARFPEMLDVSP